MESVEKERRNLLKLAGSLYDIECAVRFLTRHDDVGEGCAKLLELLADNIGGLADQIDSSDCSALNTK